MASKVEAPTTNSRSRRGSTGVSIAAPARTNPNETKSSGRAFTIVALILLLISAALWLMPSLWALKTSVTPNEVSALGAGAILKDWSLTLQPYKNILSGSQIWYWYLSSAVTSIITVVLTVLLGSMAGYAISRLRFGGRNVVLALLIGGIMIPGNVLIVPIFQLLNTLGLLNTYWAVIFPQVPAVITLFVFMQFFDALPRDYEESARLDGAGFWTIYLRIVMPLSKPIIAAMAIVSFVGVWNNLILPLYVLSNPDLMTIPVGLSTVQGSYGQRVSDIQASSILGSLPLVIAFLIFQKRIVEGFASSGLKG